MGYTIDIDTGGTFTDGFFVAGDRIETVKVPTTPHDLTVCFLECIQGGADRFGVSVEDLLYDTDIIRFSNTIGTNTIIQRDGTRIGLIVTAGCEDLAPAKDEEGRAPLVRPDMVLGLNEKVGPAGELVESPDEAEIMALGQELIDRGARCLVVALTRSELNPENERKVRRTVKQEYPRDFLGSVPVFLSSDISKRSGEQERINAAVLNAYIHGKLVSLLYKAGEKLRQKLYQKSLFIVHNNNAVTRVAKTRAINTYNSGPAAGLLGARLTGALYDAEEVISADMGGTSFDVGCVNRGRPSYTLRPDVEGFAVNVPMISIRAVGAGGGSIASVREGALQVGPQSAGALPGPVCFNLGGTEPTVTDADVVLGVLDPDYFLGGGMKLDAAGARQAMKEKVAEPLGVSVEEAALAVKANIDEAMGRELARMREQVGGAPLLVVYGGAGPAHCCRAASAAGLKKIVVTPFSAVFSAFSSSSMDVGHVYYDRVDLPLETSTELDPLGASLAGLEQEADRDMRGEGYEPQQVQKSLELLVREANGDREVKFEVPYDLPGRPEALKEAERRARSLLASNGRPYEGPLVLNMISLVSRAPATQFEVSEVPEAETDAEAARKGSREVFLDAEDGTRELPVYDRDRLTRGHCLNGPALVDSEQTTVFVAPGWTLSVDRFNNAVLEEGAQP
jgi:N-methylhydantoinase A